MKLKQKRNLEKLKKQKKEYPEIAKKIIKASDIILEVLDARFVQETRNLRLEKEIKNQNKRIIYVINKKDLVLNNKLKKIQKKEIYPYVFVSCKKRIGIKKLRDLIKIESKKLEIKKEFIEDKEIKKLKDENKINIGIIGYPNTGKSSLINILIGKKSAGTGAEAGFTKGFQRLKLTPEIVLIDTPGIIPKEIYSQIKKQKISEHTKLGGRSYSQVKEPEMIIAYLMKEYRGVLEKFYNIKAKQDSEIFLEKLGGKRGFFKKKGEIDTDKTARYILRDWQEGKIRI